MRILAGPTPSLLVAVALAGSALAQGGRTGGDASGKKELLFLGSYSVDRSAGEHYYVTQLDLWRSGSIVVGLYAFGFGLQGDRPPILIDRLAGTYDDATRRLVLKHDVLDISFTGTLEGDRLVGRLVFSGDVSRYLELLKTRCNVAAAPSITRNSACMALGEMSEKAGGVSEAQRWYRLGCNSFRLPLTCCSRLENLTFSLDEHIRLREDCNRDD